MLKLRVIPTMLYSNFTLVKGQRFDGARVVGDPMQAVQVYNLRNVDELCFMDITASAANSGPDFALIDRLSDRCFMPLTVGGGVSSIDQVRDLLLVGADKVAVNTVLFQDPALLRLAADRFGTQCMVAVIDTRMNDDGVTTVWSHNAKVDTLRDPATWASELAEMGAGEILLQCADRDGSLNGYDLETIERVRSAVSIPVIASGGAGTYQHMVDAVNIAGADAVAAAAMFHFTEQTPSGARDYLRANGIPTRM